MEQIIKLLILHENFLTIDNKGYLLQNDIFNLLKTNKTIFNLINNFYKIRVFNKYQIKLFDDFISSEFYFRLNSSKYPIQILKLIDFNLIEDGIYISLVENFEKFILIKNFNEKSEILPSIISKNGVYRQNIVKHTRVPKSIKKLKIWKYFKNTRLVYKSSQKLKLNKTLIRNGFFPISQEKFQNMMMRELGMVDFVKTQQSEMEYVAEEISYITGNYLIEDQFTYPELTKLNVSENTKQILTKICEFKNQPPNYLGLFRSVDFHMMHDHFEFTFK